MERRVPCESQLSVFPGLDDNATTDKVTRPRTGTFILFVGIHKYRATGTRHKGEGRVWV